MLIYITVLVILETMRLNEKYKLYSLVLIIRTEKVKVVKLIWTESLRAS